MTDELPSVEQVLFSDEEVPGRAIMLERIASVMLKSMEAQETQESEDFDSSTLTPEDIDQLLSERELFMEVQRLLKLSKTTKIFMYTYATRRLEVINRILLEIG